jgi:predicted nuclease of predicted toxin-antitoxin system
MRILLDESIPERLGELLDAHAWSTVRKEGWAGLKNGVLLLTAANRFDVLLTADKNMEYQQNLRTLPMSILVIRARSNRLPDLQPLVPEVLAVLDTLGPRRFVKIP